MTISIRDVAEHAGVSVGTVSNVLNTPGKVSSSLHERVLASIEKLGYVRNDAARQLRAGRSSTVGLVVLDVRNPFFTDVARGAEDEAAAHGISVILGNSDEDTARESAYLDLFEEQRVRGLLISPYGDVTDRLTRLRERGIPAVLVDRVSTDLRISSVAVDDVAGGALAVSHLLERGRRRLAFVGGPLDIRQVADRLEGAERAVADAASADTPAELETITLASLTVLEGRRVGLEIAQRPAADRPDALFAANDLVAMGLLQALVMQRSIRVPDDIAIVGFDDIDFASAAVVPLTSVRQPSQAIGRTAVQILLEEAADADLDPRHVLFQPELVTRESSA